MGGNSNLITYVVVFLSVFLPYVFLQICLNGFGLETEVDGEFGPLTEKAVKAYQRYKGLEVDGKVGADTWSVICGI